LDAFVSTTGTFNSLPWRCSIPFDSFFLLPTVYALQLGALQRLNRMLSSPVLHIKQHAALSLSFLCSTNASVQLAALDIGALSVVQELLSSRRTEVAVTGLRFIFNLACVIL
jgi:hypothetical protein